MYIALIRYISHRLIAVRFFENKTEFFLEKTKKKLLTSELLRDILNELLRQTRKRLRDNEKAT